MADLVTVYRAIPTDVPRVVGHLERHCLQPVVIDDIEKMSVYRGQAHQVRIAVPGTQRDMAIRVLAQLERQDGLRLFSVIRQTRVVVLLLVAALGLVAIIGLLDNRGVWFAGIGILLAVVAAVALIRLAWRRESGSSSGKECLRSEDRTHRPAGDIEGEDPPCTE